MGASFAIALTLVIFAGSDLFTGHTMFMTLGWLQKRIGLKDLGASWDDDLGRQPRRLRSCSAALFVAGGGGVVLSSQSQPDGQRRGGEDERAGARAVRPRHPVQLAVCLAIWTSARMTNDTAKCIAIFWCLYAFIASGFEHSIAEHDDLLRSRCSPSIRRP